VGKKFISFEKKHSVTVLFEDVTTGIIESISAQFLIAAMEQKVRLEKT